MEVNMNKFKMSLAAFAATATMFSAVAASMGDVAPALKITDWVQGGPAEVKAGQITVVEFWATWCPPCRTSIPHINGLYNKYKDQGVVVIGVSFEEKNVVSAFIKKMGAKMQYPVALGTEEASKGYMEAFGVRGIPHAFVVGADGKFMWQGHPMAPGFEKALEDAIAKKAEVKAKAEAAREKAEDEKASDGNAPEEKTPENGKPTEPPMPDVNDKADK